MSVWEKTVSRPILVSSLMNGEDLVNVKDQIWSEKQNPDYLVIKL